MATTPRSRQPRRQPARTSSRQSSSRGGSDAVSTSARILSSLLPKEVRGLGIVLIVLVVAVVAYLVTTASDKQTRPEYRPGELTAEALMEVKGVEGRDHSIIPYTGMTVCFNENTHQPDWVAWELLAEETEGSTGREPGFSVDPSVDGCATPADYRHSGFDRGHMAPAGDMKWHPQAMRESFYMTNIAPQAHDLNRGAWKKLEEKCRQRAVADSALIIICGPIFDKEGPAARIGATGVAVPSSFFKVILAPYVEHPWAIGFIMPNSYVDGGMQKTAVTVDQVEAVTGYDFFSALPDELENDIEGKMDFNAFSHVRRR